MPEKILLPHTVTIEDRNRMTITGVRAVTAYDEFHIILNTDYGRMTIQGRNLSAGEMSSSQNVVKLSGDIEIIQYKARTDKSRGLLSRVLK